MTDPLLQVASDHLETALEIMHGSAPMWTHTTSSDLVVIKIQEALWWTRLLIEEAAS